MELISIHPIQTTPSLTHRKAGRSLAFVCEEFDTLRSAGVPVRLLMERESGEVAVVASGVAAGTETEATAAFLDVLRLLSVRLLVVLLSLLPHERCPSV
ncbi:hypothetical protein E2C01_017300 [Portunus trituberculatus]|uniref:Uncharacterized protein n=1 Tax=Portunus trituberculatus TaxID=210409 RepID=A0A5B7DT87_PORTR|nr:hypothetical protein [Portunus trituberculatus]